MNLNKIFSYFFICALLLSQTGCTHTDSQKGPESTESLLKIADRMRLEGNEKTAHSFYAQVLEKDPKNKRTHIALGQMLRKNKEYDQALKQFQIALLHHPESQQARGEIVKTYITLNQGEMAALEARSLIKNNQKNPAFHNLLGVALDLQEKHLEAQDAYGRSLELQPDQLRVQSNLGLSLAFSGQYSDAISLLERVVRSGSALAKDRHNLAVAYGLSGDLEKAEAIFRVDLGEDVAQKNTQYLAALKTIKAKSKKQEKVVATSAQPSLKNESKEPNSSVKNLYVQAGTYTSQENAQNALKKVQKICDVPCKNASFTTKKGNIFHRVLVGPLQNNKQGETVLKTIEAEGFAGGFMVSVKG